MFDFWIRNLCHVGDIATHLVVVLTGATLFKKPKADRQTKRPTYRLQNYHHLPRLHIVSTNIFY